MHFSKDQVFAAASAAFRINKGYFRSDKIEKDTNGIKLLKERNALVMYKLLTDQNVSILDSDYIQGQKIIKHFQSLMFSVLAESIVLGKLFKMAYKTSEMAVIEPNTIEFNTIARLPQVYIDEIDKINRRKILDELENNSTPFLNQNMTFTRQKVKIISCVFHRRFNNYAINVLINNHLLYFFSQVKWNENIEVEISAKVQFHYNNKTTKLCNVKLDGEVQHERSY